MANGGWEMSVWHYTVGVRLRSILEDRTIKLATEGVPVGERPAVWSTISPKWEPTANKVLDLEGQIIKLGKQETAAHGEGLYRIELLPEAAPYGWEEYRRLSHIPERMAKSLARIAREQNSHYRDWRVSFEPIPQAKWLRIEFEGGNSDQWRELSTDLVTAWTRPVIGKGCLVCSEIKEQSGAPWRYMPDPDTGEPRVLCASCYALRERRVNGKLGSD